MSHNPYINEIECDTAEEFLSSLSLRGEYFGHYETPFIFRGHANDQKYQLIPSALRDGNEKLHHLTQIDCVNNESQVQAEIEVIYSFFQLADAHGLPLPEDSQRLRRLIHELKEQPQGCFDDTSGECSWPPNDLLSLVGLAQHHGLPTRLLDWSRNPYTATYFSAKEAAEQYASQSLSASDNLSVWALSLEFYSATGYITPAWSNSTIPRVPIALVTAPSASNSNLNAQDGVFTLFRSEHIYRNEPIDRRSLDELFRDAASQVSDAQTYSNLFYHFTLSVEEAGRLLTLLAKEGFDSARHFPGYDGVVQALLERRYYRK